MRTTLIPRAALIALMGVLLIELVGIPMARELAWPALWRHSSPRHDDALRFAAQLELADASKRQVYIMGSSQARENVDPDVVSALLDSDDVEVWNLGVAGGDSIDAFLQLDAIRHKPPQLVVLVSTWVFFYDAYDPTKLELYATTLPRLRELAHLYGPWHFWKDSDGELSSTILAILVPSVRWARSYLSRSLVASAFTSSGEPRLFAGYPQHDDTYFTRTLNRHGGRRYGVTLDTVRQRRAFVAFASEVKAAGIDLVVVEGPVHPRSRELAGSFLVIWQDYLANMRKLSHDFGFEYVPIHACDIEDTEFFADLGHLNERGREVFTRCITRDYLNTQLE